MKRLAPLLALFIPLILPASTESGKASGVSVTISAHPTEIQIGDRIEARITAEWDPRHAASPALASPSDLGAFEILEERTLEDRQINRDRRRKVWSVVLTSFETGAQEIPSFTVRFDLPDDGTDQRHTEPAPVVVHSALSGDEPETARPLKEPATIPPDPKRIALTLGLAVIVLGLCAILAWALLRRRRGATEATVSAPAIPVEQTAMAAFEALEREGLPERGEIKEFYTRLSHILRVYLGGRFGMAAIDMTSAELLGHLGSRVRGEGVWEALETLCLESDMAKFARWMASEPRCRESLRKARDIVRTTTPNETEVGEGARQDGFGGRPRSAPADDEAILAGAGRNR